MKDNRSLEQKIREVHNAVLEAAFDRNTKIRMKMSNVGRPTDNVKDETSKLAKQGEIQRKIIEDSEYGMARNELETAKRAIDRLNAKMGKGEGELEAWVQAKITKAADYLDTVADYIESGSVKEEVVEEADMPSAHKMAKGMVKGFRGHKVELHPDGSATVHTKGGVDAHRRPTYSSANVVDSHLKNNRFDYNHPTKEYDNHTQSKNGHTVHVTRTSSGHSIHIRSNNVREEAIEEDTAVASVSTKDTPKEQPEPKSKKNADNKYLMEPDTIKGGKTEVDTEPTTDDRSDDGKKINKNEKATKAANAQAGVKEETMNTTKHFGLPADLIAAVTEALKGNQHKIDANHNGKIDGQDFKILKGKKKVEEEVEELDERDAGNKAKKDAAVASVGAANKDEKHLTTKGTGIRGFSEAELARIEEIASNIDEVVTARKLTPADKAAKAKYLAAHKAKLASHDTGIEPKKSFKDVNNEPGNYTKQPSKMGIRHSIGSGYYKNDT